MVTTAGWMLAQQAAPAVAEDLWISVLYGVVIVLCAVAVAFLPAHRTHKD